MSMKAVAPGKAVLTGEYSVLAGGPAVVLATNSFVSISLELSLIHISEPTRPY